MNPQNKASKIVCISCSIFRSELEELTQRGDIDFKVRYLNSMLHMQPEKLHHELDLIIHDQLQEGNRVLLLYGACHAFMNQQENIAGVYRVKGANCCQILLGRATYRDLCEQRAFMLLPEWMTHWEKIFQSELGLDRHLAKDFMPTMLSKLIYIDTGSSPISMAHLNAISDYSGLSFEILKTDINHLLSAIRETLARMTALEPE